MKGKYIRSYWRDGKPEGRMVIVNKNGTVFNGEMTKEGKLKGKFKQNMQEKAIEEAIKQSTQPSKSTIGSTNRNSTHKGYEFYDDGSVFRGSMINCKTIFMVLN